MCVCDFPFCVCVLFFLAFYHVAYAVLAMFVTTSTALTVISRVIAPPPLPGMHRKSRVGHVSVTTRQKREWQQKKLGNNKTMWVITHTAN